jgi:tRNA-Thr(GGU) m(6)t(6)A37 methyltransferase TsaA
MKEQELEAISFQPIGVIRTPYKGDRAPYQALERDEGEARLVLDPEYEPGLKELDKFKYIYVLYYMDRAHRDVSPKGLKDMIAHPPWAGGKGVGLFASRSPHRPNAIGLSIVRVREIKGNVVVTSLLDAFDRTPLLDIKPYLAELDAKDDANYGWLDENGRDHLMLHIRGIPHDH